MYKPLILALSLTTLSTACKKKEPETCNYKGNIFFKCASEASGPYYGFIDSVSIGPFSGGDVSMHITDTGLHILRVTGPAINALDPPISYKDTVRLEACGTIEYHFP